MSASSLNEAIHSQFRRPCLRMATATRQQCGGRLTPRRAGWRVSWQASERHCASPAKKRDAHGRHAQTTPHPLRVSEITTALWGARLRASQPATS